MLFRRQKNDRLSGRRGSFLPATKTGRFKSKRGKQREVDKMRQGREAASSQLHHAHYLDDRPPHAGARAPRDDCRRRLSTASEMGGSWFELSPDALQQGRHEKGGRRNVRKEATKPPYILFDHRGGAGALIRGSADEFSQRQILMLCGLPVSTSVVPLLEFLSP